MDVLDAVKRVCEMEGVSGRGLSLMMGRSGNYMSATMAKGSDIGASNLARMANAMGWRLVLRKGDVEVEVSPRD